MKKVLQKSIILMAILVLVTTLTGTKETYAKGIGLYFDNQFVNTDNLIENLDGTTYIPISYLTNQLNVKTTWDNKTKVSTIIDDKGSVKKSMTINISTKKIVINKGSQSKTISTYKPYIKNGRTMVPIRLISEFFGFSVSWDGKNQNVLIYSKPELANQANTQIPILMYHAIDNEGKLNDTLFVTTSQFDKQMKALKDAGYNAITPHQLYDFYYNQKPLPSNPIFITFDDGYENNKYGYSILKKYNQKATIFGIVSRIEHRGKNSFPGEIAKLKWEDYQEMSDVFTLQNHTNDSHRQVTNKNGKKQGLIATPQKINGVWETQAQYKARITNDIATSQNMIKTKMGYNSVVYSYPYGQYSVTTLEVLKSQNVPLAVTIKKGTNNIQSSRLELNRITVDGKFSGNELVKLIKETK